MNAVRLATYQLTVIAINNVLLFFLSTLHTAGKLQLLLEALRLLHAAAVVAKNFMNYDRVREMCASEKSKIFVHNRTDRISSSIDIDDQWHRVPPAKRLDPLYKYFFVQVPSNFQINKERKTHRLKICK